MRRRLATALSISVAAALALALTACGDDDDGGGAAPTDGCPTRRRPPAARRRPRQVTPPGPPPARPRHAGHVPDRRGRRGVRRGKTLARRAAVATGEPAFPPYVIDDAPETGRASRPPWPTPWPAPMGFAPDAVTWTRTTFEGAIQPGPKDFDFNLQQYSITPEREAAVSFSHPYYAATRPSSATPTPPPRRPRRPTTSRTSRSASPPGRRASTFVTDVIQPTSDPFVFNDNAAAKQALDTKQIDAIVADLPTAHLHHARRDGGLRGVRPVPARRQAAASRGACCSPRTARSSSAPT